MAVKISYLWRILSYTLFLPSLHLPSLELLSEKMVLRWVVNFGLVAIPIGGTIGAILGIEAHRQANGQAPLFAGGGNDGGSGSGGGSTGSSGNTGEHFKHNGITYSQYCNRSIGIPPGSTGEQFTCEAVESLTVVRSS